MQVGSQVPGTLRFRYSIGVLPKHEVQPPIFVMNPPSEPAQPEEVYPPPSTTPEEVVYQQNQEFFKVYPPCNSIAKNEYPPGGVQFVRTYMGTLPSSWSPSLFIINIRKKALISLRSLEGGGVAAPYTPDKLIKVGRLWRTTTQLHQFYNIRLRIVTIPGARLMRSDCLGTILVKYNIENLIV